MRRRASSAGRRLAIDLLPVGDDARDRAEAAGDAHGAGVGEGRQTPLEHARVELVGLAVDVEIGPGKARRHQGSAEPDDAPEQGVHMGVLRAAKAQRVEPR